MSVADNEAGPARTPAEKRAAAAAAEQAQRDALLQQLRDGMPQAMRERAQWLVWKFIPKPKGKPAKVPFYVNGRLRGWPKGKPADGKPTEKQPQVVQGDPLDREHLATLDEALRVMTARPQWAGIGFAFLPGDGLIGVDIDHAIDAATGEPSELCRLVVEGLGSYTELSPSGTGVHVIVAGELGGDKFKDDLIGLEVYAGSQYFTCTGARCSGGVWPETPAQVQPADAAMLAYMRELVAESLAAQKAEKAEKAAAVAPAAPAPSPIPTPSAPASMPSQLVSSGGDDFQRVNAAAMQALHAWVPSLLPEAEEKGGGYRVTSRALGRDLQEDLSIQPTGIKDFGVADMGDARGGKRSPVDLVHEYGSRVGVASVAQALRWLAQRLGVVLSQPRLRRVPPSPPPAAEPEGDAFMPLDELVRQADREGGAAGGEAAGHAPQEGEGARTGRGKGRGKDKDKDIARADELTERFALVYGSDTAWDRQEQLLIRIPAMRLAFGKSPVNIWLARDWRDMVRPQDLVFEPNEEVRPPQINMWSGLDLVPVPASEADVQPMLDLLEHLCSETEIEGEPDPVSTAVRWVLSWQAIPLQKPGTKLATACVFHGAQGTGKNLYWDAWRDLFGLYGITVSQTELEDKYNGWVSRKLAIVGDEVVSRQELYHNKNRLKLVVTQEKKFAIRGMFLETRWESNHANVVFLSNEITPLVLEDRDRRYLVIYTPLEAEAALYQRVRDFLATPEGPGKWLYYLQHYDVGDHTAHTKPPMTAAKEALIQANWRPSSRFAHEWLRGFLELPVRVCSAEQLYRAFRRWCDVTGARFPPDQFVFTNEVKRWVSEQRRRDPATGRLSEELLEYKNVNLTVKDQEKLTTRRKTVRCWLPHGTGLPPEAQRLPGVTEGQWATEGAQAFEEDLRRYCRRWAAAAEEEGAS